MPAKRKFSKRKWVCFFFTIGAGVTALTVTGLLIGCDRYVAAAGDGIMYHDLQKIPVKPIALVLGTARTVQGRPNQFYFTRIHAAVDLYQAGKVRAIVVSGDHTTLEYDEPGAMKADLIDKGIPAEHITCDHAGLRTLDSIIRMEKVFGQTSYVVVSQPFHVERALFLASEKGHDAVGFAAANVSGPRGVKVRLREILARTIAVGDIYIWNRKARFLGPPINLSLPQG